MFIQRVKTIIVFNFTLASSFFMRLCFDLFSCALLVTSCCCLNHLPADDETSNVLKRSVKNMLAHVLALCLILRSLKRSNRYPPTFLSRFDFN